MILGYCTNVHAGRTLGETLANLDRHAVGVRERASPGEPLPVGLWLSARAADDLIDGELEGPPGLRRWLEARGLRAYTLNGFPAMDFHQPIVKHAVYRPNWLDPARLAYTRDLIRILHGLLPEGETGSISTVPLGWPTDVRGCHAEAAANLLTLARELADLEERSGRLIHLDLEPEPGCSLGSTRDAVRFFEEHLFGGDVPDEVVRRYLRVCHDTCHAAVMDEPQAEALAMVRDAGVCVGKVQLSSAIAVDFDGLDDDTRTAAREQLRAMAEERYLHQTHIRGSGGDVFYDDLPAALDAHPEPRGEWRVHYHVPIYLQSFGHLSTTRGDIAAFLAAVTPEDAIEHYEVETYAWNVLPPALQRETLAEGLADELRWAGAAMSRVL